MVDGFLEMAGLGETEGEVAAGGERGGVERNGGGELQGIGKSGLTARRQGDAEVFAGLEHLGIKRDGGLQLLHGLRKLPGLEQGIAKIVTQLGEIGIEPSAC